MDELKSRTQNKNYLYTLDTEQHLTFVSKAGCTIVNISVLPN